MDLVLVPRVEIGRAPDSYFRPSLPASLDRPHGWGQASGEFAVDGKVLCWARPTQAERDQIVAAGGRVIPVCASAESDRMLQAMREGDLESPREEFVAAYREPAKAEEDLARAQRGIANLKAMVAAVGLLGAALWLSSVLGISSGASLALVALHFDNLNGADGTSLAGRAFSDGLGSWTEGQGTWFILTNAGRRTTGARGSNLFDSAMSAIADYRVTATDVQGNNCGILSRRADNNNFYFYFDEGNVAYKLFKRVASTETQLGSNGQAPGAGKVLSLDCSGTSITGLVGGAVDVGPVTDSALATGKGGLWSTANQRRLDDFLVELPGGRGKVNAGLANGSQLLGALVS